MTGEVPNIDALVFEIDTGLLNDGIQEQYKAALYERVFDDFRGEQIKAEMEDREPRGIDPADDDALGMKRKLCVVAHETEDEDDAPFVKIFMIVQLGPNYRQMTSGLVPVAGELANGTVLPDPDMGNFALTQYQANQVAHYWRMMQEANWEPGPFISPQEARILEQPFDHN
jgi:hypothetical protein